MIRSKKAKAKSASPTPGVGEVNSSKLRTLVEQSENEVIVL